MISRFFGIFKRNDGAEDCSDPDCIEVRELSSEYIDGELHEAADTKITKHVGWCKPCSSFVSTLRATVGLLRAAPKRKAPSDFRQRIRENIPRDST